MLLFFGHEGADLRVGRFSKKRAVGFLIHSSPASRGFCPPRALRRRALTSAVTASSQIPDRKSARYRLLHAHCYEACHPAERPRVSHFERAREARTRDARGAVDQAFCRWRWQHADEELQPLPFGACGWPVHDSVQVRQAVRCNSRRHVRHLLRHDHQGLNFYTVVESRSCFRELCAGGAM